MRNWRGRQDVPVYKILWPYHRTDDLIGRPRKLLSCIAKNCASPLCYEISIPMRVDGRPEMATSQRHRRWSGGVRRPVWHSTDTQVIQGLETPVCPQCHTPTGFSMRDMDRYEGKQIRCKRCEAEDEDLRARSGLLKPEPAYRWGEIDPYVQAAMVDPGASEFVSPDEGGWENEDGELEETDEVTSRRAREIERKYLQDRQDGVRARARADKENYWRHLSEEPDERREYMEYLMHEPEERAAYETYLEIHPVN